MNLANKITMARLFLVPICVLILLINNQPAKIISVVIFILACLTDALDGYVARKKNLITDFGKFMDPLVDKLLVSSVLIALVDLKKISCWVAIIIIWRELIITGFRLCAVNKNIVIAANKLGKIKTVSQMIMIIIIMLDLKVIFMIGLKYLFIFLALVFSIWSGIDYIYKNKEVLKD